MAVIVQQKRQVEKYFVPAGGEILWFGIAANVPSNFVLDSYMANAFVRGANIGGSSNTPVGSDSHTHTNPANTGTEANHTHAVGAASVGSASGSATTYGAPNADYANAGHGHGSGASTSGAGGGHSHTLAATAAATMLPPYKKLYLIRATVDAEFPVGGIVMWNNILASRPLHTNLCNGSLGTLDLRSFFVYGASTDGDLGATGGATTHSHNNTDTGAAGSHTHTTDIPIYGTGDNTHQASTYGGGTNVSSGGHGHGMSPATGSDANHSHTVGATDAVSSLPSYLKLYFLMRTE